MPLIPSTIPRVTAYLYARINAAVIAESFSDPAVTVALSGVEDAETPDDIVIIGRTIVRTPERGARVGSGSFHYMRERYGVSVEIVCADQNELTFDAVDGRAYHLLALIEQTVRDDPSLGGLVIEAMPGASESAHGYSDNHDGARAEIAGTVDVFAEL